MISEPTAEAGSGVYWRVDGWGEGGRRPVLNRTALSLCRKDGQGKGWD